MESLTDNSVVSFIKSFFKDKNLPQTGDFYSLDAQCSDGTALDFSSLKGKVVLIVNTASKCGFTNQYAALEKLYVEYKDSGLVVLGFPSNDFMHQEPGSDQEIQQFCSLNFGVTFPVMKKGAVTGSGKQRVFKFLTEESPGKFRGGVLWNFEKFLVSRGGVVVGRWRSVTSPEAASFRELVLEELGK